MSEQKTCVYINLETVPFVADLVFPKGISQGEHVSLIFGTFDESKAETHAGSAEEFARALGKKIRVQSPIFDGVPQCFIRISLKSASANLQDARSGNKNSEHQETFENLPNSTEVSRDEVSSSCSKSVSLNDGDNDGDNDDDNDDVSDGDAEEKEFLCYKCPASFESEAQRRSHMSEQHNSVRGCPFCPRKFLEKYALVRHMWSHLPPSTMPFRCSVCKGSFLTKKELLLHKSKTHEEKSLERLPTAGEDVESAMQDVFICKFCSDAFLTHRGYKQHLNKCHRDEKAVVETSAEQRCSFCDSYVAPNFRDLCLHLSEKHPEANVFSCSKCSLVFTDESEAQNHEKSHVVRVTFNGDVSGGKEYHCGVCNQVLTSPTALLSHVRSHNVGPDVATHVCDVCYASFQSRSQLRIHVAKQHRLRGDTPSNFVCSECEKSFARSSLLKRHCRAVHNRSLLHACVRCPKKFSTERQRQRHLAVVHRSDLTQEELEGLTLIQRYVCEECSFSTYSSRTIRRHVYAHTGQFPHVCDECGRGFVFGFELSTHRIRDHRRERYTCERCPRAFYSHDRFERHISAHDGGWGFACLVCKRLFETAGYLESHRLIHSEQRPYECSKCGKRFRTPQGLTFHDVGHHQSRSFIRNADHWRYRCCECNISFKYASSLHAHNAFHHVGQEQRLECRYCSKKFSSKVTLSQHLRNHMRENVRHQCGNCKKTFVSYGTLRRHEIVNHARKQKWNLRAKGLSTEDRTISEPMQEVVVCGFDGDLENAKSELVGDETFAVEQPYNATSQEQC